MTAQATQLPTPTVEIDWLAAHLHAPDVKVLDGSWHMPATGRDAEAEFADAHIPGAVFFDIDGISDHSNPLPHMMPSPAEFAAAVAALGISNTDRLVVYDRDKLLSAPRVWWMFRYFGHDNIAVLDGELKSWIAAGHTVEHGPVHPEPAHFTAGERPSLLADKAKIAKALHDGSPQIFDARSQGRFEGKDPEPRPGLPSGHMPGAHNLPFSSLLNEHGHLHQTDALADVLRTAGLDLEKPVIATCGSGVSACGIALAGARLGCFDIAIYDGSWSEWAIQDETSPQRPIATGQA